MVRMDICEITPGNSGIIGLILQKLRELTNDFTPPEHACTTWRVCYATLAEFEADLHQHIHLENNILFIKAIEMEKELFAS